MTIEQMTTVSEILLVVAILLAIVAVIIYFKYDINRAWHLLTGRRIKPKEPRQPGKPKTANLFKHERKGKKATSNTEETVILDADDNQTTLLEKKNPSITERLISEMVAAKEGRKETTLLDETDNGSETVLLTQPGEEGTVLLSRRKKQAGNMKLVQDITYIHTDIRIG